MLPWFMGQLDNDSNDEKAWLGWTSPDEPSPEYSVIPMEIIEDVADQWDWSPEQRAYLQQVVTAHEIGHHFELFHSDTYPDNGVNLMTTHDHDSLEIYAPQRPLWFTDADGSSRMV